MKCCGDPLYSQADRHRILKIRATGFTSRTTCWKNRSFYTGDFKMAGEPWFIPKLISRIIISSTFSAEFVSFISNILLHLLCHPLYCCFNSRITK
jgi:hypothetical protein